VGEPKPFDFDQALAQVLAEIDIGPHCGCADITMELLRVNLPLPWTASRYAAAGFGGGVGGSAGPCGAFCAGIVALSLYAGREEPPGCIAESVETSAQRFYDEWLADQGSILCADLTGYPSLRDEQARDDFFASGGVQKCTERRIRFAVEKVLELAAAKPTSE
jgi:C_GCAxxG_C_C family probable redox protein